MSTRSAGVLEVIGNVMRRGGCPVWSVPADESAALGKAIDEIGRFVACTETPPTQPCEPREQLTRARMAEHIGSVMLKTFDAS